MSLPAWDETLNRSFNRASDIARSHEDYLEEFRRHDREKELQIRNSATQDRLLSGSSSPTSSDYAVSEGGGGIVHVFDRKENIGPPDNQSFAHRNHGHNSGYDDGIGRAFNQSSFKQKEVLPSRLDPYSSQRHNNESYNHNYAATVNDIHPSHDAQQHQHRQQHNDSRDNNNHQNRSSNNMGQLNHTHSSSSSHSSTSGQHKHNQSFNRSNLNDYDDLKFREVCLRTAEEVKSVLSFLERMQDHIQQEASLSREAIESHENHAFPLAHLNKGRNNTAASVLGGDAAAAPKEAIILEHSTDSLRERAVGCMKAMAECYDTRKGMYLAQLKKIREISNMATRNAVQNERAEHAAMLTRLRAALDTEHQKSNSDLMTRNTQLETENAALKQTVEQQSKRISELVDNDQNRVVLQGNAVKAAEDKLKSDYESEKAARKKATDAELKRMHEEFAARCEDLNAQHQSQQATQQTHDSELRQLLVVEKERAEKQCEELRRQVLETTKQITAEKEKAAVRLKDELDRAEERQHAALAEATQAQARLKAEMAAMVQRLRAEDTRRKAEQDMKASKYKEQLLTTHAIEVEKLNERHRSEMKKYQAELQVRSQEMITKLKHLHSQEVNRLIRENDRLHRIVVRTGGADLFRSATGGDHNTSFSSADPRVNKGVNSNRSAPNARSVQPPAYSPSLSPPRRYQQSQQQYHQQQQQQKQQQPPQHREKTVAFAKPQNESKLPHDGMGAGDYENEDEDDDMLPPPPPPLHAHPHSAAGNGNTAEQGVRQDKLNWGALQASLEMQDTEMKRSGVASQQQSTNVPGKPRFSADYMPPNTFALDESVASAKLSPLSTKVSKGIEANAVRVGNYMNKLENYLQGSIGNLDGLDYGNDQQHDRVIEADFDDIRNSSADEDDDDDDVAGEFNRFGMSSARDTSSGVSNSTSTNDSSIHHIAQDLSTGGNNSGSSSSKYHEASFGAQADARYRATRNKYGLDAVDSSGSRSGSGNSGIADSSESLMDI